MPRVSIVVPHFNYATYLDDCLESIEAQAFEDFECIIVDDGSRPEELDEIGSYMLYYSVADTGKPRGRFHIIEHPRNFGYNTAKNTGILASQGEFIRLIDADDVLTPNALEDAVRIFDEHPEVDLVHGYADRWYGGDDFRGVNKKTFCHAQGRMWRRSVYDRFGLYYEALRSMGDKEFIYRLGVHPDSPLPKLVKDYKLKKVVARYRKHEGQMHKVRRLDEKKNAELKKQFKKRIKQLKREGITRENTKFT